MTNCHQLKMRATDGKMRLTDTEQLFRLIQSIPSPKAEPFKLWLAQLARERLDEMSDPEQSIDRALKQYLALGYSENWINQRLKSIEIRKELTDAMPEKVCQQVNPISTSSYPAPAKRPIDIGRTMSFTNRLCGLLIVQAFLPKIIYKNRIFG